MAHIISYKQVSRLRLSTAASESLAYGLSLLFILLFLYTVYHKAVAIDAFSHGIARIPIVGTYSVGIAWGVLIAEALVALLLIWPDTNRLGLWGALGLMVIFTVYISAMLLFAEKLPCHCGGAIEKLTWRQHLLFNCGFIALAAGLLLYHYKVNVKHKIFTAMKAINSKVKKATFGMMAAALTMGFSAFTVDRNLQGDTWYYESGTATLPGSYSDEPVANCDDEQEVICEIKAPNNGSNQPKMNETVPGTEETVEQQITRALLNFETNETVQSFRTE